MVDKHFNPVSVPTVHIGEKKSKDGNIYKQK